MRQAMLCAALALSLAAPALAQTPSLVGGTWVNFHDDPDPVHPGNVIRTTTLAQFSPAGRLSVRISSDSPIVHGAFVTIYRYDLTSDSTYSVVAVDYAPKQTCGAGGFCGPAPPFVPMGARSDCAFQFRGALFVDISCDGQPAAQFTRH